MELSREARIYWVQRPKGDKDLLIFDAGYSEEDIHIYEHRESRSSKEIEKEMKAYYRKDELPKKIIQKIVSLWISKKLGHSVVWKITNP